jgi:hypothetical protein
MNPELPTVMLGLAETPTNLEPNHAMLDLETLGKRPYCPLLSIGACAMRLDTHEEITDLFYQPITLESCLAAGLRVDASTIQWWMTNEHVTQEAREMAFGASNNALALPMVLDAFTDWLQSRPLQLWGNSARFDLGILESAYLACGKEPPWDFRLERCYRTVKNLPGAADIEFVRVGTYHNAVHDAVSQALHLRQINLKLQLHL